jgi:hypothetical protein
MTGTVDETEQRDLKPFLIGFLVDVSASMGDQISDRAGTTRSRLESLEASLDGAFTHVRRFCEELENPRSPFDIFALGFGFGNLLDNLLSFLGKKPQPGVRSLLTPDLDAAVIDGNSFLAHWEEHREVIHKLALSMGGATPLVEAAGVAESIFARATATGKYNNSGILFVLSDGIPTDTPEGDPKALIAVVHRIQAMGVVVVSCFVTNEDETSHKTMYAAPQAGWSEGASLMFACASVLTSSSPFWPHLREYRWNAAIGSRLFAQINHSEMLDDVVRLVVAPIRGQSNGDGESVRVFVSYSHHDQKYVSDDRGSLLSYLRGLADEGLSFWHDQRINAGSLWDGQIRRELVRADIALVLVSQEFLNSAYCKGVEVPAFIESRRERGLRILPIVLSPCDWQSHGWLSSTQALPGSGKTLERDYAAPGKRKELFLKILQALRQSANQVKSSAAH